MAQFFKLDPQSSHFARSVKSMLEKWGYQYDHYSRNGLSITKAPTSARERLHELTLRCLGIDV